MNESTYTSPGSDAKDLFTDPDAALAFLKLKAPKGPWVLTSIVPDGPTTTTRTFEIKNDHAAKDFIAQRNRSENIYYTLNELKSAVNKKPTKKEFNRVNWLHVDADPNKDETPEAFKTRVLPIIKQFTPHPSVIVDSGNGLQLLWRLKVGVEVATPDAAKKIEEYNLALAVALKAPPGTQNIDRLLRVPGLINYPNKPKRDKGRVACQTRLIEFNKYAYTLGDFSKFKAQASEPPPKKARKPRRKKVPDSLLSLLMVPGAGSFPSRSELFWAFIHEALRRGIDENDIIDIVLDSAWAAGGIYQHIQDQRGDPRKYVEVQIAAALNDIPDRSDKKKIIRIYPGKTDMLWRATERALFDAGCPVYVRGGGLVQPLWRWEQADDQSDKKILTARLVPYNEMRLADVVAHHAAAFQKFDNRDNRWHDADPPKKIIESLIEMQHWIFHDVRGIITSPTMRPDGSILTEPGYDEATQLWYKSSSDITLPPIPERPTRNDALKALELLDGLLKGFPFENDDGVSRSVALAAILTATLRGAFTAAPMFAVTAPEQRSGKTYLARLASVISTGHEPVFTSGSREDTELEKRIETAAMSGRSILLLNNLPNGAVIASEALAQIATEGRMSVRRLGKSEEVDCDCRATTVILTGNNIAMSADLAVRTAVCRLNVTEGRTESRTFDFDPIDTVRENRGQYLTAAFIIARAFIAAGCPNRADMKRVAGFDSWSRFVQQPLGWLDKKDPFGAMEEAMMRDPSQDELSRLLEVLDRDLPHDEFTVADCRKLAEEMTTNSFSRPVYKYPELRDLMTFKGAINLRWFGQLLRRHEDRRIAGGNLCYRRMRKSDNAAMYKLFGRKDRTQEKPKEERSKEESKEEPREEMEEI